MARPIKKASANSYYIEFSVFEKGPIIFEENADSIMVQINAAIDEEITIATAERDKRIENLNAALEKAIERLNEYAADDYCEFEDGETGCYAENAKIIVDKWLAEIRAIATRGQQ